MFRGSKNKISASVCNYFNPYFRTYSNEQTKKRWNWRAQNSLITTHNRLMKSCFWAGQEIQTKCFVDHSENKNFKWKKFSSLLKKKSLIIAESCQLVDFVFSNNPFSFFLSCEIGHLRIKVFFFIFFFFSHICLL